MSQNLSLNYIKTFFKNCFHWMKGPYTVLESRSILIQKILLICADLEQNC